MGDIEHWIGVRMAAGYDAQDFIELADSVAGRPSVERVEISNAAPDTDRGAVGPLEELEAIIRVTKANGEWINPQAVEHCIGRALTALRGQ